MPLLPRRFAAPLSLLIVALSGGGCATLERGTVDKLSVLSDPAGATATTSTARSCVTPCSFDVSRWAEFTVTLAKPGFMPRTIAVKTQVSDTGAGFFMENVVTAGIGGGVDLATGATLEHVPNPLNVTLAPAPTGPSPKAPAAH